MRSFVLLWASAAAISVDFDDKEWKTRPVTKVINLLKDMESQLSKEQESDAEVYDKMQCWCETNDKAKTKSIAANQKLSKELAATIDEATAQQSLFSTNVESLEKEIKKSTDALQTATAIRQQEHEEFAEEEQNALGSISSLKGAVTALGSQHRPAAEVLLSIQHVLREHGGEEILKKLGVPLSQRRGLGSFLQQPASMISYTPASGQIFGILNTMKESFETNVQASQKEEARSDVAYTDMSTAKSAEVKALTKQRDGKLEEYADATEKLAEAKRSLKDTDAALDADVKFLSDLKERCSNMDSQFAIRQKTRAEEMQAVSETVAILSNDEARDLMSKTTSFLQTAALRRGNKARLAAAARVLESAAQKSAYSPLSVLAMAMKSDVFGKVKESIDKMVTQLSDEQKHEVQQRDYCMEEIQKNEKVTSDKYDLKSDLETRIQDLKLQVEKLGDEITAAKSEISDILLQMKRAGENRAQENKEFQMTVADQKATQAILKKALDRLSAFYAAKLVQTKTGASKQGQAPPAGFGGDGAYKKSAAAGGVMAMIQGIIAEAKSIEDDAIRGEQDAQSSYEAFMQDANLAVTKLNKAITDNDAQKAKFDGDKIAAEAELKETMAVIQQLSNYAGELHASCDFILKNFELRQDGRAQEIDALKQAKAILSGADFDF